MKEAHLSNKRVISRTQSDTRAFSLSETDLPKHDGTPESTNKILDYLNVEKSERYKPTKTSTYCNIYAHDFAKLMGAYIPRVWWTDAALKEKDPVAVYARTVVELNANSLYEWFEKQSSNFGWEKLDRITDAQVYADQGKCVIAVAANSVSSRSGHITAVVPSTCEFKPFGSNGVWIKPVQSQAGAKNAKRFVSDWWKTGHKPVRFYVKK